jgi:hypothetical protein
LFVTTKSEGSGLGLALVAKLVNDHGGGVEWESNSQGTRFRVLMPLSSTPPRKYHMAQLENLDERALPAPVAKLYAPFAYGWNASQRVAAIAGAQNLADYSHFSSEEDHRQALEACQVGGKRLLKALNDGRYNARKEYREALEYYVKDLPKTAGGSILLANDQVRILHAMFLADAAMLPEGFASRLRSVIANQFALNAFYEVVERHNEAAAPGTGRGRFRSRRRKASLARSTIIRPAGSSARSRRGYAKSRRRSRLPRRFLSRALPP